MTVTRRNALLGIGLGAGLALAAPGPLLAAAAPDWRTRVSATPQGTTLVGNPAAKVTLTEWLSFTCPHCGQFATQAHEPLGQLIGRGAVRMDMRMALRDRYDMAAALLVSAAGPHFLPLLNAVFAAQEKWIAAMGAHETANRDALSAQPLPAQMRSLANAGGLLALARAAGMTPAAINAAFTQARIDLRTKAAGEAWQAIRGTPAFEVNGTRVSAGSWSELAPLLVAAGAA